MNGPAAPDLNSKSNRVMKMDEYKVSVLVDASCGFTVRAETPEAAAELADELYFQAEHGLCHQCARVLDVGDPIGAIVWLNGAEVLDTSHPAARIRALEAECARLQEQVKAAAQSAADQPHPGEPGHH